MNRDVAPSDRASLLGAFPRWAAGGLLLLATTAAAQGPIPFELNDPGEASQIVEMFLALEDVREPSGNSTRVASDAELRIVANRNTGGADEGSLWAAPTGAFCVGIDCVFTVLPGETTGSFWVVGDGAPYTTGLYHANNNGAATPLEPVSSNAESSYDFVGGTMDVRAEVDTPDYGEWRESVGEHGVEAEANVLIHDWVYVDGPGPTATVSVSATIDPFVDSPVQGTTDDFWTTQAYGDLREILDPNRPTGLDPDLLAPTMTQVTRLEVRLDIDEWFFEEICEGEDEDVFCFEEWVSQNAATASALRENYQYLEWDIPPLGDVTPLILRDDTDTLTSPLATQATIPTGEWVEVSAQVIATADCEGAFGCNLDAWTGDPVQISITSPDGTLVAWHGIAGLTRVPEPADSAPIATAMAAIAALARRRGRPSRIEEMR